MPSTPKRFEEEGSTATRFWFEAEALEDLAESIIWTLNRGHLKQSGAITKAMDLHKLLLERVSELKNAAALLEREQSNKEVSTVEVPQCPRCNGPMIFSMCLPRKEFVCFPCGIGEEAFNGLPTTRITAAEEGALRVKYRKDAHALAELRGSGQCVRPDDCPLGMEHPIPKDYQFEFFNKGINKEVS